MATIPIIFVVAMVINLLQQGGRLLMLIFTRNIDALYQLDSFRDTEVIFKLLWFP